VRKVVVLMMLGAISIWAVAAHAARPATDEKAVSWAAIGEVHSPSHSIRIQFSYPSCGVVADDAVSRIVVARAHRTIVVTVLMKVPAGDLNTVCPQVARVYRRTVALNGRLGSR
jgi:hypothetical protein